MGWVRDFFQWNSDEAEEFLKEGDAFMAAPDLAYLGKKILGLCAILVPSAILFAVVETGGIERRAATLLSIVAFYMIVFNKKNRSIKMNLLDKMFLGNYLPIPWIVAAYWALVGTAFLIGLSL